jgi:hypothetical protein
MILEQASTSTPMEGMLKHLFWLGRVAINLHIAEGFGGLDTSVPMLTLLFSLNLSQVPFGPLVSPILCGPPLPGLCFP